MQANTTKKIKISNFIGAAVRGIIMGKDPAGVKVVTQGEEKRLKIALTTVVYATILNAC